MVPVSVPLDIVSGHCLTPVNDGDEPLIVPKRGRSERMLPADALLLFSPQDLRLLRAIAPRRVVKDRELFLSRVQVCRWGSGVVAVAGPMLGAPQAVLVLEKLIALGVRRVVAFGWCGCLAPELAVGDLVLPSATCSEEGTSKHYPIAPADASPDPALLQQICLSLAGSREFVVHQGRIWSTDAPYRETREKVDGHRRNGLLAVEMECSALFTVARFRGIGLAACLVVSDDLSGAVWRHGYDDRRFRETRERILPHVLDTLLQQTEPQSSPRKSAL